MTRTLANGAVVPTNSDEYMLTDDLASLALSLNVTIRVASADEQLALPARFPGGVIPIGTMIMRTDDPTLPTVKWDGAKWVQFIYAEALASTNNASSGAPWGLGQLVISEVNSTDKTFVTFPEPDCVRFAQPGAYSMSIHVKANAPLSGFTKGTIQSSNGLSVYGQDYPGSSATEFVIAAPVIYFPNAGGQVFGKLLHNSGNDRNFQSVARIIKVG